jgi:hypothetical protein
MLMRRLLIPIAMLAVAITPTNVATAAPVPHVSSCANSYPHDGHPGPWRTTNSGGVLHGNTLHISCPSPSTHWDIIYRVQANNGIWINEISDERSGNGSPADFSENLSPYPCDTQNVYRTHVENVVTGGTINKPAGGGGVHLTCGALAAASPRDTAVATAAACTHNSSAPQLGGGIQTTQSGWCNVTWHAVVVLQVEQAGTWGTATFDGGGSAQWTSAIFGASTQHNLDHTFTNVHQSPYCAYNWRSRTNFWQGANPPYTNIGTETSPELHKTC